MTLLSTHKRPHRQDVAKVACIWPPCLFFVLHRATQSPFTPAHPAGPRRNLDSCHRQNVPVPSLAAQVVLAHFQTMPKRPSQTLWTSLTSEIFHFYSIDVPCLISIFSSITKSLFSSRRCEPFAFLFTLAIDLPQLFFDTTSQLYESNSSWCCILHHTKRFRGRRRRHTFFQLIYLKHRGHSKENDLTWTISIRLQGHIGHR